MTGKVQARISIGGVSPFIILHPLYLRVLEIRVYRSGFRVERRGLYSNYINTGNAMADAGSGLVKGQ